MDRSALLDHACQELATGGYTVQRDAEMRRDLTGQDSAKELAGLRHVGRCPARGWSWPSKGDDGVQRVSDGRVAIDGGDRWLFRREVRASIGQSIERPLDGATCPALGLVCRSSPLLALASGITLELGELEGCNCRRQSTRLGGRLRTARCQIAA